MKSLLLKWVGGKNQIIDDIKELIPKEINNYYEPFLGGGTVLFNILELQKTGKIKIKKKIIVNDLNTGLINFYINIKNNPEELFNEIQNILNEYKQCPYATKNSELINRKANNYNDAIKCSENYYYWKRNRFNSINDKSSIEYSALFWFLNKTGFRGIYREGPNGYNVPFGHYKNSPNITKEQINEISILIQKVKFVNLDFQDFFQKYKPVKGDFIYFDPPYAPENKTSFVKYNKEGFDINKHKSLFSIIKKIANTSKILLSNAKVSLVTEEFKKDFVIKDIECKRHINSKKPNSKTMEVLITN